MKILVSISVSLCMLIIFFSMNTHQAFAYQKDPSKSHLVDIRKVDPWIVIDLRYATTNNFTKKKIYPAAIPLLRKETAYKLAKVNQEVKKRGYRVKIWDGYRPFSAQRVLWNASPDKRYVADPNKGSKHNRGAAVDITLVDQNRKEVIMPTGFDHFTPAASRNSKTMNQRARINLNYLTHVMKKHGFKTINSEWWHYEDTNWAKYPLLDVPLEAFK
ncbi:D-alanyl-D-alanine dipeptidase [Bacillus ectoiniformans]|uniref:M15 family metallopeptidase n=1 Tax=Bacillus ectoiniformans TaxID=1494429 RepID=UPI001957B36F|nr:M15 family metallopeptidase [Bacillus ectoiniformans]MBM7649765.1 D-alanyl-D-alanine dipeptidase [Bacillus ectoiniformans]